MADGTHIEWTDATWQIVTGCSVVSPGCTNCYAMRLAGTRLRHHPSRQGLTLPSRAGPVWNGLVRFNVGWLTQPLTWKEPRRIFVAAHGDLFHDGVKDWMLVRIFAVMALCGQHTFQVLTKRADRMHTFMAWLASAEGQRSLAIAIKDLGYSSPPITVWPLPNVWLGVSVEDQPRADERLPWLIQTRAAIRWVSAEPMLGHVDFRKWLKKLNWIVVGGESGPHSRPADPRWFTAIRDQCQTAAVPFFFKQHGDWADCGPVKVDPDYAGGRSFEAWTGGTMAIDCVSPHSSHYRQAGESIMQRVGKKNAGARLDDKLHQEYPPC